MEKCERFNLTTQPLCDNDDNEELFTTKTKGVSKKLSHSLNAAAVSSSYMLNAKKI